MNDVNGASSFVSVFVPHDAHPSALDAPNSNKKSID
jgi:hypothetical protein